MERFYIYMESFCIETWSGSPFHDKDDILAALEINSYNCMYASYYISSWWYIDQIETNKSKWVSVSMSFYIWWLFCCNKNLWLWQINVCFPQWRYVHVGMPYDFIHSKTS